MKMRNLFILATATFVAFVNIGTFCYASSDSKEDTLTGAVPSPVGGIVPANSVAADGELPQSQITLYGVTEVHKKLIFIMAAREGTYPGTLRRVCREWRSIIDEGTVRNVNESLSYSSIGPCWQAYMRAVWGVTSEEDEEIFRIFLEGKLVYKPDLNSDEGKIELAISDFANPFSGIFDLSACGKTFSCLKFTTDPSDFFAIEKREPKLNILMAPHFLINRYISTTTKAFATIMGNWDKDKPVGIFWRWGSSEPTEFDYLVSSSLHEISSSNMWENYTRTFTTINHATHIRRRLHRSVRARPYSRTTHTPIRCLFVNQN